MIFLFIRYSFVYLSDAMQ